MSINNYIDLLKAKHRVAILKLKGELDATRETYSYAREEISSLKQKLADEREKTYMLQVELTQALQRSDKTIREVSAKYTALAASLESVVPPPLPLPASEINLAELPPFPFLASEVY